MSKTVKIIIAVAVVVVVLAIVAILGGMFGTNNNSKPASNLTVSSENDLTSLIDQIYNGVSIELPMVATMPLDKTDPDVVKVYTGLENGDNLEYLVVSEPMMTSQAYSLILAKVKDGVDVEAVAKSMNENINERKWICVTAEKIYTTTSGNVVCLVMSNEQTAQTVFDSFKAIAGSVGNVYERAAEEFELPDDMLIESPDGEVTDDELVAAPAEDGTTEPIDAE